MDICFFGDFVCQSPERTILGPNLTNFVRTNDFNVINFEAPIRIDSPKLIHKSGPNISQCPESVYWLENVGINVIAMANNHILDLGRQAAQSTVKAFKKALVLGIGDSISAYQCKILERGGIKIGIISVTHREFSCVEDYSYGCAWMNSPKFYAEIVRVRPIVDYLFIYNHGGLEYFEQPLPQYRDLYRYWIDLGCDAVLASHPHVPQGFEEYNGKLIFYSLGNFLFEKEDGNYPPLWNNSLGVKFHISKNRIEHEEFFLKYDPDSSTVEIDNSQNINDKWIKINQILRSPELYSREVNQKMNELAKLYSHMLEVSGYTKLGLTIQNLKSFVKYILRRPPKPVHHLNLYRCETHRWVMEYLLSQKLL